MANGNDQARVQNLASMVGVDWNGLWSFLQVFQPAAREAIITILEQIGWLPKPAQESMKGTMVKGADPAQISSFAAQAGVDSNFLQILLQRVGPILAQIILALLAKPTMLGATSSGGFQAQAARMGQTTPPQTSGSVNNPHGGQQQPTEKTPTEQENAPEPPKQ